MTRDAGASAVSPRTAAQFPQLESLNKPGASAPHLKAARIAAQSPQPEGLSKPAASAPHLKAARIASFLRRRSRTPLTSPSCSRCAVDISLTYSLGYPQPECRAGISTRRGDSNAAKRYPEANDEDLFAFAGGDWRPRHRLPVPAVVGRTHRLPPPAGRFDERL